MLNQGMIMSCALYRHSYLGYPSRTAPQEFTKRKLSHQLFVSWISSNLHFDQELPSLGWRMYNSQPKNSKYDFYFDFTSNSNIAGRVFSGGRYVIYMATIFFLLNHLSSFLSRLKDLSTLARLAFKFQYSIFHSHDFSAITCNEEEIIKPTIYLDESYCWLRELLHNNWNCRKSSHRSYT